MPHVDAAHSSDGGRSDQLSGEALSLNCRSPSIILTRIIVLALCSWHSGLA